MLVLDRPASDPQLEAARRYLVEGGGHLRQHSRMAKLVAQDHVSDLDVLGSAEQGGGQSPRLERGIVGRAGSVEVVVEPQRVYSEFLAAQCAVENIGVAESHLR